MRQANLDALRELGWTDPEISAAAFVCSYFNFINRVADGLGVDPEDWMTPGPDEWISRKADWTKWRG